MCRHSLTHPHIHSRARTNARAQKLYNILKRDAFVRLRRYCAPVNRYQTTQISNVNWQTASLLQPAKKRRSHTPSLRLEPFVCFAKRPDTTTGHTSAKRPLNVLKVALAERQERACQLRERERWKKSHYRAQEKRLSPLGYFPSSKYVRKINQRRRKYCT